MITSDIFVTIKDILESRDVESSSLIVGGDADIYLESERGDFKEGNLKMSERQRCVDI